MADSSSPFPLFKLPILAIESILYVSELHDLIVFSTLAKKCHRLVRSLRKSITRILPIVVRSESTWIGFYNDQNLEGCWMFKNTPGEVEMVHRNFRGVRHYPPLVETNASRLPVENGLGYLKELFNLSINQITAVHNKLTKQLVPLFAENTKKVYITGTPPISNGMLTDLLETSNTEWFILNAPIRRRFRFAPERFKFDKLTIAQDCSRTTWNSLTPLNLTTLKLESNALTLQDCCSTVREWLNSDNTKFAGMLLTLREDIVLRNEFESFETVPWCRTRRSQHYKMKGLPVVDCERALDIRRRDGLWASINFWNDEFFFGVWHTSFHQVRLQELRALEMQ